MKRLIPLALLLAGVVQAQDRPAITETITVSTTSIGLSAATLGGGTTGQPQRTSCFFTLETANVRWLTNGKDPDTNTGHVYASGATLSIDGYVNLVRLRFIRDDAADATLTASCW